MASNASAGLVSALKTSLADAAALWCVLAIHETTALASVSGTVTAGEGSVAASTRVERRVALASPKVRVQSANPVPLRLDYVSVRTGGAYTEGLIAANGVWLRSTDADLDTAVLALATAYEAAADTALAAALTAGPGATPTGVMGASLVAALKASLDDEAAGWAVRSRSETAAGGTRQVAVVLGSLDVTFLALVASAPEVRIPAGITYMATTTPAGALLDAAVIANGAGLRVIDADLHTAVMALADAYLAAQSADILAAL